MLIVIIFVMGEEFKKCSQVGKFGVVNIFFVMGDVGGF
jgi:hypothetical protein